VIASAEQAVSHGWIDRATSPHSGCRRVYIALILLLAGTAGAEAQQPGPSVEAGVEVRFCDLPRIEGHAGKFMLRQMLAVAELEAGMISDRTKKALAAAKARGVKLGGDRGNLPAVSHQGWVASCGGVSERSNASIARVPTSSSPFCGSPLVVWQQPTPVAIVTAGGRWSRGIRRDQQTQ
jgi:hypothetical protein